MRSGPDEHGMVTVEAGDLAANNIPIDVLPYLFTYPNTDNIHIQTQTKNRDKNVSKLSIQESTLKTKSKLDSQPTESTSVCIRNIISHVKIYYSMAYIDGTRK